MKKLLTLTTLFLVAIVVLILYQATSHIENVVVNPTPSPFATPEPIRNASTTVTVGNRTYAIFITEITNPESLVLIPNFTQELSSAEIKESYDCSYGINGGFYTPEQEPLGLFIVNNNRLQEINTQSDLVNGFFIKHADGTLELTPRSVDLASLDLNFALQSGPLFRPDDTLTISGDKFARRSLVAQTDDDQWYFVVITEESNTLDGPRLADLPEIIVALNRQPTTDNRQISKLLNLDGGSASAYYSNEVDLSELTTIGSFLCGK